MRRVRSSAVFAALVSLVVLAGSAPVSAQAGPTIRVNPPVGAQTDTFTFTGQGFDSGAVLDERYLTPAGTVLAFMVGGEPAVVNADDGSFVVIVQPANDFEGHDAGTWGVVFCLRDDPGEPASDPNKCWSGTIDIAQ